MESDWKLTEYWMQGIFSNASELAVIEIEITKTATSFLAWYKSGGSSPFCYN